MTSILAQSRAITRPGADPGAWRGVAPDARLVVVKAFSREGQGGLLDIVRGVQWIVDHREEYGIRVVNLSFAAKPRWPYWQDPINQALMRAAFLACAASSCDFNQRMSAVGPKTSSRLSILILTWSIR